MNENPLFLGLGRETFMGIRVVPSNLVQPVPRIQVRDIKLRDGTSILSPEFLARENAWWRERFGMKEVAYFFDGPMGRSVAMNPKHMAMLKNFV